MTLCPYCQSSQPCWNGKSYAGVPCQHPDMPAQELRIALAVIEEMAEERHLLHGGVADAFWNCSRPVCKKASEFLRGKRRPFCQARKQGTAGGNDPAECDWPFCGCDPVAGSVLAAIQESGLKIVKDTEPVYVTTKKE